MGVDLCVLGQIVSLISLKMKRMLAFEKRCLLPNSLLVISYLLFLSFFPISLPS